MGWWHGYCGKILADAGYINPAFSHWRSDAAVAHMALGNIDAARSCLVM